MRAPHLTSPEFDHELPPGCWVDGHRYEILHTLFFARTGGVYVARDYFGSETGSGLVVIKELVLPPDEQYLPRAECWEEACQLFTALADPGMARVQRGFRDGRRLYLVQEKLEGLDLERLMAMSPEGLPEQQVLAMVRTLCHTLARLYQQSRPFMVESLEPQHLILTRDGLRLVHLGIRRLVNDAPLFGPDPHDQARVVRMVGRLLFLLLTGKESEWGFQADERISPEVQRLILFCAQAKRTTMVELAHRLDEVLEPPAPTVGWRNRLSQAWARVMRATSRASSDRGRQAS